MWNDVDVDFGGDETGNFGPRKETGSALYQIDTIATISSQEEVEHNPRVFATAREDGLCVSAGNNLSIFGQCGHDFLVTIDFGADIDVLEWSCDSQFIVAGTSNGRLHFVDIERQKILFSKDLVPASEIIESKAFQRIVFTLSTTHTSSNLLILTSSGKIVRITHIDLTAIREAKSGKDAAIIMQQLKIEKVDTSEAHDDKVSSADVLESHRLVITAGRGDAVLSSWRFDGIEGAIHQAVSGFITNGVGVKKCRLTQGGKYLITLQNDYSVGIWNTGSLSMFMQYSDLQVEDFALIETGDKTYRLCDTKIVLLTSASAGGQQLHVCTMPSFKSVYCIELSENTYLAEFPSNTENIYVVEGVCDEEGHSDLISTLRLRCLSEAMPDTRLNRILHKKQFNEAEQFAKQFGLDVELVYKVHTSHLLDDLSPWNVGDLDEGEIEAKHATLKTCLALISDDNHVIDCCIKAAMPTFQATLELLKYARERLNKKINAKDYDIEEDEISRPALLTKVLETIHRLTTYKIAFGENEFTGSAWDHFMKANMLQELLQWLSRGEAHIAFTIWQHHQSEFIPVLDCDVIEDILRCIPETASSVSIKAWFTSDFIPFVIRNLPSALYIVAKFVEKRARTMELNEKKDWPQNALSMAECFHNTCLGTSEATSIQGLATIGEFVTQICNMSIGYTVSKTEKLLDSANKEQTEEDSLKVESKVFLSLQRLIMNLRDLLSLHTKYNCKLSLAEYIQETTESLTYRMLDRVNAIQLIPSALEKVVKPYMKEHHLDEDKMLYQYIQDLLERFRAVSLYRGDSHWEAKAIAVIHCIKEPEYKCLSILLAMKQAYIPLSSDMDALVQEGLQLNIPRVVELKEQCKLMSLREILANYGLRNYPMGDVSRSERLVMYILHQDRPECLKDALEVVKAYNNLSDITAYIFRLNFLIKNNRIMEAMELLRSLPTGQALICGSRVVSGTLILLNTHWALYEDEKLERILFMEASIKILKALYTLDKNNDVVQEYYQYLPDLQRILALQVEFGEFMRLEDYCTEENRKFLLFKRLQLHFSGKQTPLEKAQHIDSDRKSSKSKTSGYAKIFRLANILRVSNDELRGQLAIHTARNEDVQTALKFCSELYDNVPCADTGEVLYRVAHIFCQLLAKEEGEDNLTTKDLEMLPSHIKLLASQAVTVCKPELICDCLELSKCASLADSLSKQSEIGDYGISVQRVSEDLHDASNLDPYTTWTFDKHFKEDGLVLDSSLILPLAYQYTIASLPSSEKLPHPYQQNRIQGVSRQQQIKKSQQANQKTPEAAPFTLSTVGVKIVDHLRENSLLELCAHYSIDAVSSILQHIATQSMGFPISDQDMLGVIEKEKDLGMQALLRSQGIIQDITVALISKMVSHRVVDHNLVLGNLYTLSAKGALNTLRSHSTKPGNSYKRIMYLSRIGIDLSVLLKDEKALKTCKALQVNATWGHRLSTLGIQFKEVFNGPSEHKEKILPSIVQHAEGSISLVTEYCRDFNLDPNKALCLFLDNLLHHPTGDTYSHKQMLDKVEIVIKEISDKEDLLLRLKDIYMKIDAYNYESLGFVLEQINKLSTSADIQKSLKLLEYLNDYVRQAPPSEYEKSFQPISEDDVLMYGNNNLPPQAETRLPFHLFMKAPWKIITPELNAGTVDAFVSIATLLQLQLDTVYITTIQNTIDSHITSVKQQDKSGSTVIEKANCNWNVKNDINVKMFATLKRLILCIDSCVNALGVAQYVVKALPMGPEKVWALYLAAHLAEKWLQSEKPGTPQYEQAKISTKKFTDLHRRMATEEILYKNSLGEKEFLALTGSPAKLIFQLYSHDSILRRSNAGNLDKFPDIHKVAEDISVLHKVNLQKVHLNLLEKWLHASKDLKQQEDADATMTFNVNFDVEEAVAENTGEMSEDEKNLRRVTYVLKYGKVQDNVLFLLNFTFKENSSRTTNMCRVRALRCLFNIADLETIEQIYKNPIDKIKNEMKCLLYLVELEKLRLNHTKASFAKCNKEGLVRGIWRNHSHERSAVRLVSDLCLDYKIYDVHLWNGVLQQLLAFNMMQYLEHVLVCLSGIPELWQVPCIEKMWKTVLLQHSEPTALLQRCPLLLDMPLDQILEKQ